jgi:phosphatidylglycerol:prolipoprotein diacylglycerol transferase
MSIGELFTTSGFVVGALVFFYAAREKRLATQGVGWVALAGFLGGAFGAKLTEWIVSNPALLSAQPDAMLNPNSGGRTLIGGVLCGWLAVEIAKWKLGIKRSTGDLFALALPAGEVVGRIGCHFNTCCFGVESTIFCALYQHGSWRFPSQLLSSFVAFAIFMILWTRRKTIAREGDLFRWYLLLYGASRFGIEFTRERHVALGGLSVAQWVCLEMTITGVLALWLARRKARVLAPAREAVIL